MVTVDLAAISEAVKDGDQHRTVALVQSALDAGAEPLTVLNEGLVPGIKALGSAFRDGQVYLPEVLVAARAMNKGVAVVAPHLPKEAEGERTTVVIGSVSGDMHDIGKTLVRMMLEFNGFRVVDLGVDVTAGTFVSAAKEHRASIVAMSALLTTTMSYMPEVIAALRKEGVTARVLVGGAPLSRAYATEIGAEGFAADCIDAVDEAKRLVTVVAQ